MNIVDHITALAARSLTDHVITCEEHAVGLAECSIWRVGKPGTSVYAFIVTTIPQQALLMITGDLGCAVWQRDRDMITWMRGAVKDLHYFAEKMTASAKPARRFSHDKLKALLQEYPVVKSKLLASTMVKQYSLENCDPGYLKQVIYDSAVFDGCDFPDLDDWGESFLWQWRAIIKWLELIG